MIASVSAFIFYIVWKGILKSDAVEVPIIAIVSSAIGEFFGFRSARALQGEGVAPFMAGVSTCWLISGALFFVISLVCTLLPTSAEMYARFSLGTVLGIALISALMSGLPAVLTRLICQAATWLKSAEVFWLDSKGIHGKASSLKLPYPFLCRRLKAAEWR